jgi:hypothetical protein
MGKSSGVRLPESSLDFASSDHGVLRRSSCSSNRSSEDIPLAVAQSKTERP